MITYVILLITVALLTKLAEQSDYQELTFSNSGKVLHTSQTKHFYLIASIILICVAGLRYGVGTDFFSYYFTNAGSIDRVMNSIKTFEEPVQEIFYAVVHIFSDKNWTPIFAFSVFTVGLALKVIFENTNKLNFSVLLFLFLGCWTASFNAIRQCMAASIVFCGLPYLRKKQFVKYFLIIIVAFLTHRSSIIMLPMYFILHNKINVKNIILLIFATVLVLISYDRLFSFTEIVMQQGELSSSVSYYSSSVNIFRVLVAVLPAVYYLYICRGQSLDEEIQFYMNIAIIHAILMVMASKSVYLARVTIYTALFLALAIPELNSRLDYRNMRISKFIMVILYSFYWLYDIYLNTELKEFYWIWNA